MNKMEITQREWKGKMYDNVKLEDIPLNGTVTVKKIFKEDYPTKYDSMKVTFEYQGKNCGLFMNPKTHPHWEAIPVGSSVNITRTASEVEYKDEKGDTKKSMVSNYELVVVGEKSPSSPSSNSSPSIVLSQKQLDVVKHLTSPMVNADDEINFDGVVKKIRDVLPAEVVANPEKYVVA